MLANEEMIDHAAGKRLVAAFLDVMARADRDGIARLLDRYVYPEAVWRIFHPFNTLEGSDAVANAFRAPLK